MGDVVTTTATILSVLFFRVTGINIDGFVGIGVALVVYVGRSGHRKRHAGAADRRSGSTGDL